MMSTPVLWKWTAIVSMLLLLIVALADRHGLVRRGWRRIRHTIPAGDGIVPGAGRSESEARYPDQYRSPDNRASAILAPFDAGEPSTRRADERFIDVGGRAYSREFIETFSYDGSRGRPAPEVRLTWLRRAETFVGMLAAEGLKPNFAYQVKLLADPDDGDAFERIGYLGRWSLPGDQTNISDQRYARDPLRDQAQSYLLFDFFVTDEYGAAEKPLYADSSLHVLFHADYQRPPRPVDSAMLTVVTRDPGAGLYANPDAVHGEHRIYGEAESGSASGNRRPPLGRATLPPGAYRARLVLTEESFHWFGDGGRWATVLGTPVAFEIISR